MNDEQLYRPLVSLLSDKQPALDQMKRVIKGAARKSVPILDYQEQRFYDMLDRANLSKLELTQLRNALESAANTLDSRNEGRIAEKYRGLATYVYHASVARRR